MAVEYGIINTKSKGWKKQTDEQLEAQLNAYASRGWRIVATLGEKIIFGRKVKIKEHSDN